MNKLKSYSVILFVALLITGIFYERIQGNSYIAKILGGVAFGQLLLIFFLSLLYKWLKK